MDERSRSWEAAIAEYSRLAGDAGSAVDAVLEDWHCRDAGEVYRIVADLLPRIANLPALAGPTGGAPDARRK